MSDTINAEIHEETFSVSVNEETINADLNGVAVVYTNEGGKLYQSDAGENISALKAVYVKDNKVFIASCDNASIADKIAGISITAANQGGEIVYQDAGIITDNFFNFDLDKLIFCGLNGAITQTANAAGFSQIIGIPVSNKSFKIQLKNAILTM